MMEMQTLFTFPLFFLGLDSLLTLDLHLILYHQPSSYLFTMQSADK